MKIDTLNRLVNIKHVESEPYVFIRYCDYNEVYNTPACTRVEFNKLYMNYYDFLELEIESVESYDSPLGKVIGLKYKSL